MVYSFPPLGWSLKAYFHPFLMRWQAGWMQRFFLQQEWGITAAGALSLSLSCRRRSVGALRAARSYFTRQRQPMCVRIRLEGNACSVSRNSSSLCVAPCVLSRDTSGALRGLRGTIRRALSLCEEESIAIETGRFFVPRSGALNDVKGGISRAVEKGRYHGCRKIPLQSRKYGWMLRGAPRTVWGSPPFT